jgi:hypothetical protein
MDSYGACQSEIPAGPSAQYFCDLGTGIPATVTFAGRGEYPTWGNLTGLNWHNNANPEDRIGASHHVHFRPRDHCSQYSIVTPGYRPDVGYAVKSSQDCGHRCWGRGPRCVWDLSRAHLVLEQEEERCEEAESRHGPEPQCECHCAHGYFGTGCSIS